MGSRNLRSEFECSWKNDLKVGFKIVKDHKKYSESLSELKKNPNAVADRTNPKIISVLVGVHDPKIIPIFIFSNFAEVSFSLKLSYFTEVIDMHGSFVVSRPTVHEHFVR